MFLVDADLAGSREAHQQEDDRHQQEVDECGEVQRLVYVAVAVSSHLLPHEVEGDTEHQPLARLMNNVGVGVVMTVLALCAYRHWFYLTEKDMLKTGTLWTLPSRTISRLVS